MSDINNFYGNVHNSNRNPYVTLLLMAAKYLTSISHLYVLLHNVYEQKSTLGNTNCNKMTYCMLVYVEPPDYL